MISEASGAESSTPPPVYISDAQRRRLFAIARERGWEKEDLHVWLITQGIGSTSKIAADEYDAVVSLLLRAAP